MPKVTVEFGIAHNPEANRVQGNLELSSLEEFWHIADLGFPDFSKVGRGNPKGFLKIRAEEGDPRLAEIYRIAAKHGLFPSDRVQPRMEERTTRFRVVRRREYSPREIAEAELLRLNRYGACGKYMIGEACYPKGNSDLIGAAWRELVRETTGNDDAGWRLRATKTTQKSKEWGQSDQMQAFLLATSLKQDLEAADLRGLSFLPVRYDRPEKADRQLWTFGHETKMPRCLVTRLDQGQYTDCGDSNDVDGAVWDDGGYRPEELRFRRCEVDAMGPFDAATTLEKVGANRNWLMSEVIVTQRFRHTLAALGVKDVHYIPVRLVD